MKQKKIIVIALMLLAFSSVVFAQGITYGADLELALPMGDFGDMANMGFGATGQVEYGINDKIVATGSVGYLMWSGKDTYEDMDYSWSCIPIKAGAKYNFGESGLYGIFELGMYMFSFEFDYEYDYGYGVTSISGDDSESEFGFAPGIGYQKSLTEKMDLDLSLQYEMAGDFDYLGIDIGIRF